MDHAEPNHPDRRDFIRAGALAAAATATAGVAHAQEPADAPKAETPIPTRPLGKTGVNVTILEQGAVRTQSLDRILRFSFASGVRIFDTAKVYGSEPDFKKWFARTPEARKDVFLVTKDMPKTPKQLVAMADDRLKTLGIDCIDLFFIHGLGDDHSLDDCINMVKGQELKEASEALKKAGKIRFMGFSSHHKDRAPIIQAASEAGIIDAIMLQYRPWLDVDSPLNKALDAAHKRGIGLISMKQIAGVGFGDKPQGNILDEVKRRAPMLAEKKLTPFQGLLHAIWSDERISSVCVSMKNTDQIRENADAARRFEPLKAAELRQMRDAFLASGPSLCASCDGRCAQAAGTNAELDNIARFLTYHRHLGDRSRALAEYARLSPAARDVSAADLEAARVACPDGLDFARLLPEAESRLA